MATGKVIKRTVDALRSAGVAGFLWDEDLKIRCACDAFRVHLIHPPISDGWEGIEVTPISDRYPRLALDTRHGTNGSREADAADRSGHRSRGCAEAKTRMRRNPSGVRSERSEDRAPVPKGSTG